MMKRSTHLRLTLMAMALPAALAGCKDTPTGAVAQSVEECVRQEEGTRAECETAYQAALNEHERVAPRFENAADCDSQFGNCTAHVDETGHQSWIPPMAGFLMGYAAHSALSGRGPAADCRANPNADGCRGSGGSRFHARVGGATPLYWDRSSHNFRDPAGGDVSNRSGFVTGKAGRASSPARAVTVARGGFGANAGGHGGGRSSFGG